MLLAALLLIALPLPAARAEPLKIQVQTDLTGQYNLSDASNATTSGSRLTFRDLGFSSRWRAVIVLTTRFERNFELLAGPYVRIPVAYSFSNYGSDIHRPFAFEWGADVGLSWFGYARTLLSFAPNWNSRFQTADYHPEDPSKLVELSSNHWSVGLRVEVPILLIESDPGDRKVEFGAMLSYQLDQIRRYTLKPVGFTPDSSDLVDYDTFNGTQKIGYRWLFGAFMNFRL